MSFKVTSLTAAQVREWLSYDPISGILTWKKSPCNSVKAGAVAGSVNSEGRRVITILGTEYYAHRLALLITNGEWPTTGIDHENRNRLDNSLKNLIPSTQEKNNKNKGRYANNKSGTPGVVWNKRQRKWETFISTGGRKVFLGVFAAKSKAVAIRKQAEADYGFHPNHGGL
jgi:hypothetical protein